MVGMVGEMRGYIYIYLMSHFRKPVLIAIIKIKNRDNLANLA